MEVKNTIPDIRKRLEKISVRIQNGSYSKPECQEFTDLVGQVILLIQTDDNIDLEDIAAILECSLISVNYLVELKEKVAFLEEKVTFLEEENERYRIQLLIGQVASSLEEEIVKKILKNTGSERFHVTLQQIEDTINGKKSRLLPEKFLETPEQKQKADDNWSHVKLEYKVEGEHYSLISKFKSGRNPIAHPCVTLSEAKRILESAKFVSDGDQKSCLELLKILESMNIKNIGYEKKKTGVRSN